MARRKSMTEIQILNLLHIRPMYGVEMIEEIKRLSSNMVVMPLPTLYSSLHRLAKKKFVNSYWQEAEIGGRRHVYNITKLGREYREKNQIEIDYDLLKAQNTENKTFSTLEEAFSLPLGKDETIELPENKRVLDITPPETNNSTTKITPYLLPTDKITTTRHRNNNGQQLSIDLAGTLGGTNLRPLLKLNHVPVGHDFVPLNRLRMLASLITISVFIGINFLLSLTKMSHAEYYNMMYIILICYFGIMFSIYLVYPRIKKMYSHGKSFRIRTIVTVSLVALVITIAIIDHSLNLIWLGLFALIPEVECLLMSTLRKGKMFKC